MVYKSFDCYPFKVSTCNWKYVEIYFVEIFN